MERVLRMVQVPKVEANPLRANQVYRVIWSDQDGNECGSAWLGTKSQLNKVLAMLRQIGARKVIYETHIIPRDKSAVVSWLAENDPTLPPVRVTKIENA